MKIGIKTTYHKKQNNENINITFLRALQPISHTANIALPSINYNEYNLLIGNIY